MRREVAITIKEVQLTLLANHRSGIQRTRKYHKAKNIQNPDNFTDAFSGGLLYSNRLRIEEIHTLREREQESDGAGTVAYV